MSEDRRTTPMPFEPAWYTPPPEAAAASTELGADQEDLDDPLPEGAAIAFLAVLAAVVAALLLAHFVASAA